MASAPGLLDHWRKFFRGANGDIFQVIEQAILVAASDFPQEFINQRDQIVEKFYTAALPRCSGCDLATSEELRLAFGAGSEVDDGDRSVKRDSTVKDSKVDSGSNDGDEELQRIVSNYSYDEAEALTEEIEEENQTLREVLRIKDVLVNRRDSSDSLFFESLRRLQLMELSVEVLKATEIGKAVNLLRKSSSKQIRHLVRTLIEGWKVLVDEWVSATATIADNAPNSIQSPTSYEDEGLPSPPMDEDALFSTQTTIQLSEFFDGMDDDGNLRNNGDFDKKRDNGRRFLENHEPVRKQQPAQQAGFLNERQKPTMRQSKPQELSSGQAKAQSLSKQSVPVIADAGPGRPSLQKSAGMVNFKTQQSAPSVHRKPPMVPQDKLKKAEDSSVSARLEIAKRKLQESYQQAENAKKQRTIQVMEIQDIPKQHQNRLPIVKSRNQFKNRTNGRR